jgi:purine nucleosidase
MSTTIILDCDPGIDDALAIAFAVASPEIELAGLTTVAGNVGLAKTTRNALAVASFVGAPDVPVTAGCATPLLRPALDAGHVHGDSGLGGAVLPPPVRAAEHGHAIDFIIETIAAAPGEITLVATGPLTNIALALRREPRLASWVRDFVIMGGSASRGNVNHAAEYNIWADPEAAAIVFSAGWTVRMIGLDVTRLARATAAVQERMGSLGPLGSQLLLPALAQYRDSDDNPGEPPVHDVCAIVSIAHPAVFAYTPALVQVETHGTLTSGMTVTDFSPAVSPNASVATAVDADAFWAAVFSAYGTLPVAAGLRLDSRPMAKTATISGANPTLSPRGRPVPPGVRARWQKPPSYRTRTPPSPGGTTPVPPGAPLRGTKDLTELFKPWCWCPLRGTENLTALQDPVLVAPARGKETSAAAIVSCAATACSPTSARSQ